MKPHWQCGSSLRLFHLLHLFCRQKMLSFYMLELISSISPQHYQTQTPSGAAFKPPNWLFKIESISKQMLLISVYKCGLKPRRTQNQQKHFHHLRPDTQLRAADVCKLHLIVWTWQEVICIKKYRFLHTAEKWAEQVTQWDGKRREPGRGEGQRRRMEQSGGWRRKQSE